MNIHVDVVYSDQRSQARSEPAVRLMAEILPLELAKYARYGVKQLPVWREDCCPSGRVAPFEVRLFAVG